MRQVRSVRIRDGEATVDADLHVPQQARGLVVFAHGSGSSRHSPRNRQVADGLEHAGFATLLVDLLTADEDRIDRLDRRYRFDIDLLTRRVLAVLEACRNDPRLGPLPLGLYGASTGAASALRAAAARPDRVRAVVSRGGRPDLAGEALGSVRCPTLLIVGGWDAEVMALNEEARRRMGDVALLQVVPGATHLFEEPGALERVTWLARDWFLEHLANTSRDPHARP